MDYQPTTFTKQDFLSACATGDIPKLRECIKSYIFTRKGLWVAKDNNQEQVFRVLLTYPNINLIKSSETTNTLFDWALKIDPSLARMCVYKTLICPDADLSWNDNYLLKFCIKLGCTGFIQNLVANKNVDQRKYSKISEMPLVIAIESGNLAVFNALLKDPKLLTQDGGFSQQDVSYLHKLLLKKDLPTLKQALHVFEFSFANLLTKNQEIRTEAQQTTKTQGLITTNSFLKATKNGNFEDINTYLSLSNLAKILFKGIKNGYMYSNYNVIKILIGQYYELVKKFNNDISLDKDFIDLIKSIVDKEMKLIKHENASSILECCEVEHIHKIVMLNTDIQNAILYCNISFTTKMKIVKLVAEKNELNFLKTLIKCKFLDSSPQNDLLVQEMKKYCGKEMENMLDNITITKPTSVTKPQINTFEDLCQLHNGDLKSMLLIYSYLPKTISIILESDKLNVNNILDMILTKQYFILEEKEYEKGSLRELFYYALKNTKNCPQDLVVMLLDIGLNIENNKTETYFDKFLNYGLEHKFTELVNYILATDFVSESAISSVMEICAKREDKTNLLETLLNHKNCNPESNNSSVLRLAAEYNNLPAVKLLLKDGRASPNACNGYAISIACYLGHYYIVHALLNDERTLLTLKYGNLTPLQKACKMDHQNIVNLLLSDYRIKAANI